MNKIPLKLKVTLWYVGVLVILSFFILYAMTMVSQSFIVNGVEESLVNEVNSFSRILKSANDPLFEDDLEKSENVLDTKTNATPELETLDLKVPEKEFKKIPEHSLYSQGIQMAVYDADYNLVFGQLPFGILDEFTFSDKEIRSERYNDKTYVAYDRYIVISESESYWVKGLACLSDETLSVQTMVQCNIALILAFILVTGVGGYIILSSAFVPMNKVIKTAKGISESNDLSQRINFKGGKDEISTLANAFDGMLDKIEGSFEKEKQFTSDASHELRTPISVILSECEYGEDCAESVEELKEVVGSIKSQATKMSKLISELLMISRMDSNRLKLNFEEVDLSELLEFVCEEQVDIQTKKIELVQDIDNGIVGNVDRLLITRLFINLISNAYQYSNEGTKITVSLKAEKDIIVFAVQDEGIGIAQENISKIWDRFYQVDPSRTDDQDSSSGLGLPMVKWIAECHNAEIFVNSELGKGTTFTLVLQK